MKYSNCMSSLFVLIVYYVLNISAEILMNVDHLEKLLPMQEMYIDSLESYINTQEVQLNMLKSYVNRFKKEQEESTNNTFEYLSNPLNTYLLVKQLTRERTIIEAELKDSSALNTLVDSMENIFQKLTDSDFKKVANIVIELQHTFNLEAASLADGKINDIQSDVSFSSSDCFELGSESYSNSNYNYAAQWMTVALKKKSIEGNKTDTDKADILDALSASLYQLGDYYKAHYYANQLLTIEPYNLEIKNLVNFCKHFINERVRQRRIKSVRNINRNENPEPVTGRKDRSIYEMLCNNEIKRPIKIVSNLKCSYVCNKNPFLQIAPFKMEQLSLNPPIFLFHDVIYKAEIEIVKNMSLPRMFEAKVIDHETSSPVSSTSRVGQMVFLEDNLHTAIAAIRRRAADITGLTIETAEPLQVVNYGVGGYYYAHHDYFEENYSNLDPAGNRIATLLIYLNDVTQGGATVFPELNLTVNPDVGMAVFWLNLHSSGQPDVRSLHAACPVLQGTKWISTVWFRERGQEFLRPCDPLNSTTVSYL